MSTYTFKLSNHQVLSLVLLVLQLTCSETRVGSGAGSNRLSRPQSSRRVQCPKITRYAESRNKGCISKYECKQECNMIKKCRTKYEYKCTDYKRRECKKVWQNQCNGKRGRGRVKRLISTETKRGRSRVKRFIPTETVFDQSYPLPQSDTPFASPTAGQIFNFASPPVSKRCWQQVLDCKWVKYRSSCRNVPNKVCDKKPSNVCKNKCKRVYYCNKCEDTKPTSKPKPKPTTKPKPTKPVACPPSPPRPGSFQVLPPAPPTNFDVVIVDARRKGECNP